MYNMKAHTVHPSTPEKRKHVYERLRTVLRGMCSLPYLVISAHNMFWMNVLLEERLGHFQQLAR